MTADQARDRATPAAGLRGLAGATHPGPALAVTVLAGLLAVTADVGPVRWVLVVAAVFSGQLSIGWSNDLIDLARDRQTGRADKPLAAGTASPRQARLACALAVVACVGLSLACGLVAGLVHLACVAAGWAYNLGLKATPWSWLPYAVAFGGLTVFVGLAGSGQPPWWWPTAGALLGVGAHLLNVLPDLADDAATGVRGLPHRLGRRWIAPVAALVLVAASAVILVGASPAVPVVATVSGVVLTLAVVVLVAPGRWPFVAAIAIALVDAVLLVLVS